MKTQTPGLDMQHSKGRPDADSRVIYERLKKFIYDANMTPGTRLPTERALANQFGAARNTVRKSMSQLVAEGTIKRHVGRGTFVAARELAEDQKLADAPFSLLELLEARLIFEPALAEIVVERATDDELAALGIPLETMMLATTWVAFKEAKYAMHLAIARAARNRFIEHVLTQIVELRRETGWHQPNGPRNLMSKLQQATLEEYKTIVALLQRRDGVGAREMLQTNLMRTLLALGGA